MSIYYIFHLVKEERLKLSLYIRTLRQAQGTSSLSLSKGADSLLLFIACPHVAGSRNKTIGVFCTEIVDVDNFSYSKINANSRHILKNGLKVRCDNENFIFSFLKSHKYDVKRA
ncbi:MAG: hypothetical protein DSZ29_04295 [Aquificaceae bacterium]|nr:MAG: hypothetical protein DSZ29_04295 [Aquificaceae bacterium]